jgi:hypothetical protein
MSIHTVTLDLPEEIYQRAQKVARATQRPIEQVVVEWIQPPQSEPGEAVARLETLSNDQLLQIARSRTPSDHSRRLQELLSTQQQRTLTEKEQQEAVALVEQEDLLTLQKARALFLLNQRGVLPDDLATFLT